MPRTWQPDDGGPEKRSAAYGRSVVCCREALPPAPPKVFLRHGLAPMEGWGRGEQGQPRPSVGAPRTSLPAASLTLPPRAARTGPVGRSHPGLRGSWTTLPAAFEPDISALLKSGHFSFALTISWRTLDMSWRGR